MPNVLSENFKTYEFNAGELTLQYRLYLPDDYSSKKRYPLVLFMHGEIEKREDNLAEVDNTLLLSKLSTGKYSNECIILAPQCPAGQYWVGDSESVLACEDMDYKTLAETKAMSAVCALLMHTIKKYAVKKSRIYLSGISMGGFASWYLLAKFPKLFAAAIIVCGGGDSSTVKSFRKVPIRIFHGMNDKVVPISASENMYYALSTYNGDVVLQKYFDMEHDCWLSTFEDDRLYDWLMKRKK